MVVLVRSFFLVGVVVVIANDDDTAATTATTAAATMIIATIINTSFIIKQANDDCVCLSVAMDSFLSMGKLVKWRLTLFGTPMTTSEFQERRQ